MFLNPDNDMADYKGSDIWPRPSIAKVRTYVGRYLRREDLARWLLKVLAPLSDGVALLVSVLAVSSVAAAQASGPPTIRSGGDVLISGAEDYPHIEPHLAVDPTDPGHLLVAAMVLPDPEAGFTIRIYRSEDGGATWSSGPLVSEVTGRQASGVDPWLAFDDEGALFFAMLPGWVWRSGDAGASWQGPTGCPGAMVGATMRLGWRSIVRMVHTVDGSTSSLCSPSPGGRRGGSMLSRCYAPPTAGAASTGPDTCFSTTWASVMATSRCCRMGRSL